jgi:hypothetical protein
MSDIIRCEYCGRSIKGDPVIKVLRGKKHIYCTEFCFRLCFYSVPAITYEDLQKMYKMYCVSVPAQDYHNILNGLIGEEHKL